MLIQFGIRLHWFRTIVCIEWKPQIHMVIQFDILLHWSIVIVCIQWTGHKSTCSFSLAYRFTDWEVWFADNVIHITNLHTHPVWHTASMIEMVFGVQWNTITNLHAHPVWHTIVCVQWKTHMTMGIQFGIHTALLIDSYCLRSSGA